jgi:dTDP-4-dehydrorhamnose 3,5-epimerase
MQVQVIEEQLNGLVVIRSEVFKDERGFFTEVFRADLFAGLGLPTDFVQDNHSGSVKDTVRGLHFQYDPPMAKLMRVIAGRIYLMAVDIRPGSPTLGKWFGIESEAGDGLQVFAPAGFARGFCVLSDWGEIQYKCTGIYNPAGESGILWSDPELGIEWPVTEPILSGKDRTAQTLAEWLDKPEAASFTF